MTKRLHISTITDDLSPRYRAEAKPHMGSEPWIRETEIERPSVADPESLARLAMQKMGRNPDDWRVLWNTAREFIALMEAWEEING